jgi:peptidoglycan/LPS O-acetylase OafA/YrhL
LWFLPYAFASGLLLHMVNRSIAKVNDDLVIFSATLVGMVTLAVCALDTHVSTWRPPLPQWEFGFPALPLGLAVGRTLAIPSHRARASYLCMISVATILACGLAAPFHAGSSPIPYGLAIVLVCLACGWQINGNGFVAAVAPLTFGIYLIHPLAMHAVKHLLAADEHYAAFITLTTCLSAIVTWLLMRTPLRTVV